MSEQSNNESQINVGTSHAPIAGRDLNVFPEIKPRTQEVETIMSLLEFISNDANYKEVDKEYEVDPKKKFENRLKTDAALFKNEFTRGLNYMSSLQEAQNRLDIVKAEKIKNFLILKSNNFLYEKKNKPREAFDSLCEYFIESMKSNEDGKIDEGAVRFYILNELINCNVFSEELHKC